MTHILKIAEQWGEGCADQVQTGVNLAMDEFAEQSLSGAIRKGHTLTVVSATAAMVRKQYALELDDIDPNQISPVAASSQPEDSSKHEMTSETTEYSQGQTRQGTLNLYLTRKESQDEVRDWILSHLPRLTEEDVAKYCTCLVQDGFDSTDVLTAVNEEDLHFMKKAHKRVLIQRINSSTNG